MVSGYPKFTSFPQVDGWSTNPRVLGRHIIFSLSLFLLLKECCLKSDYWEKKN